MADQAAKPRVIAGVDELRSLVGTHLGFSEWQVIDQAMIDDFARVTGDHQWIHVDRERAESGPFGGTIAHGYLTASLLPGLTKQIYALEGVTMGVNYGSDRVRFLTPVRVNSRIRAGAELIELRESASAGQLMKVRVTVEIENESRPACVVEALSLLIFGSP